MNVHSCPDFPYLIDIQVLKDASFLLEEKINIFDNVFWKGRERTGHAKQITALWLQHLQDCK